MATGTSVDGAYGIDFTSASDEELAAFATRMWIATHAPAHRRWFYTMLDVPAVTASAERNWYTDDAMGVGLPEDDSMGFDPRDTCTRCGRYDEVFTSLDGNICEACAEAEWYQQFDCLGLAFESPEWDDANPAF